MPLLSPDDLGLYLPTWILAVATTGAFIAAGFAAYFTWRALVLERTRDTDERWDRRRAQATLVSAWISVDDGWNPVAYSPGPDDGLVHHNLSDQPVSDVSMSLVLDGEPYLHYSLAQMPPRYTNVVSQTGMGRGPLVLHFTDEPPRYLTRDEIIRVDVKISFTDSAGVRWRRMSAGLAEIALMDDRKPTEPPPESGPTAV